MDPIMALNKEAKGEEDSSSLYPTLNLLLTLKHTFHTLSLTLLTLLLPLSFLLLSKLTSTTPSPSLPPPLHSLLRLLASALSVSSLFHSLTGHLPRPRTAIAWAVVCTFQACITVGIEATVAAGMIKPPHAPTEVGYLMWTEHAVFFLGLYDTMLHWMRVFVKPVVDETVYGTEVEASRADRLAIGVAFGGMWLWMMRDEVEPLVAAASKGGLLVGYTTVVIGMVRVVEIVFWVGSHLLLFLGCRGEASVSPVNSDPSTDDVVLLLQRETNVSNIQTSKQASKLSV